MSYGVVSRRILIRSYKDLQRYATRLSLTRDESLPGLGALVDDVLGIPTIAISQNILRSSQHTYFAFLHSPENANWFSGLPSGIL